ncbi:hypothetical protein YC2023_033119 [Brassica napus]
MSAGIHLKSTLSIWNTKYTTQTSQKIEKLSGQITCYLLKLKLHTRRLVKVRENTYTLSQNPQHFPRKPRQRTAGNIKTNDLQGKDQQKIRIWNRPQYCMTWRGHNDSCGRPTTSARTITKKRQDL